MMPLIWAGDASQGRAYLEDLRGWFGDAVTSVSTVEQYTVIQSQWDEVFRHGYRHYAKSGFLATLQMTCSMLWSRTRPPYPRRIRRSRSCAWGGRRRTSADGAVPGRRRVRQLRRRR
jgi:hypothetical protein